MNSLLDDYTFYGDDNQNRVHDLKLNIKLREAEIKEEEEEEVPDSIREISSDHEDEISYDLMGRPIDEGIQGIVIQGGKIMMRKNP